MKKVLFGIGLLAVLGSGLVQAQVGSFAPRLVTDLPDHVFAPKGFDNNDNVQLILEGSFKNTCYRAGSIGVKVDHGRKMIYLSNRAYLYASDFCLQVLVPYVNTVSLGILKAGTYTVVAETDEGGRFKKMETLTVGVSQNPGPDNFLYAPVAEARIEMNGSNPFLVMNGMFSASCMTLDRVDIHNSGNVIEVLPIVKLESQNCIPERKPFQKTIALPVGTSDKTLVHIRSLNGQAINVLFDRP